MIYNRLCKEVVMNKLGEWLKEKRLNKAMSQVEYADKIGISNVTLSKVESGENVGSNVLRKLSIETGVATKMLREMMLFEIKEES